MIKFLLIFIISCKLDAFPGEMHDNHKNVYIDSEEIAYDEMSLNSLKKAKEQINEKKYKKALFNLNFIIDTNEYYSKPFRGACLMLIGDVYLALAKENKSKKVLSENYANKSRLSYMDAYSEFEERSRDYIYSEYYDIMAENMVVALVRAGNISFYDDYNRAMNFYQRASDVRFNDDSKKEHFSFEVSTRINDLKKQHKIK